MDARHFFTEILLDYAEGRHTPDHQRVVCHTQADATHGRGEERRAELPAWNSAVVDVVTDHWMAVIEVVGRLGADVLIDCLSELSDRTARRGAEARMLLHLWEVTMQLAQQGSLAGAVWTLANYGQDIYSSMIPLCFSYHPSLVLHGIHNIPLGLRVLWQ